MRLTIWTENNPAIQYGFQYFLPISKLEVNFNSLRRLINIKGFQMWFMWLQGSETCYFRGHVHSKHTEQKCKVCELKFKTSMQLVSHLANEHNEEDEWNVKFHSTPKDVESI